jgi:hypothetical protein
MKNLKKEKMGQSEHGFLDELFNEEEGREETDTCY